MVCAIFLSTHGAVHADVASIVGFLPVAGRIGTSSPVAATVAQPVPVTVAQPQVVPVMVDQPVAAIVQYDTPPTAQPDIAAQSSSQPPIAVQSPIGVAPEITSNAMDGTQTAGISGDAVQPPEDPSAIKSAPHVDENPPSGPSEISPMHHSNDLEKSNTSYGAHSAVYHSNAHNFSLDRERKTHRSSSHHAIPLHHVIPLHHAVPVHHPVMHHVMPLHHQVMHQPVVFHHPVSHGNAFHARSLSVGGHKSSAINHTVKFPSASKNSGHTVGHTQHHPVHQ